MATPNDPHDEQSEPGDSQKHDDEAEDRAAILRRRALFIASTIAGLGVAAASCSEPRPCLEVAVPQEPTLDAGSDADPQPCLKVSPPQPCLSVAPDPGPAPCLSVVPDPGPPPSTPNDAGAPGDAGRPRPCLKVAPPKPCLSVLPP